MPTGRYRASALTAHHGSSSIPAIIGQYDDLEAAGGRGWPCSVVWVAGRVAASSLAGMMTLMRRPAAHWSRGGRGCRSSKEMGAVAVASWAARKRAGVAWSIGRVYAGQWRKDKAELTPLMRQFAHGWGFTASISQVISALAAAAVLIIIGVKIYKKASSEIRRGFLRNSIIPT